ncbi:UDP-N-acetylmuramate: L-alanyl-gamma-D-glutamyl-meso-diaminopimelate ligase [Spirosoma lacussanchae]|uniref:UDP-N-acetylmuramate--L-alanine ligase n=1 Tax=Spirosoma lacussanchae TaxID=1884249 RepID=UPI00110947D6|nr:Mur ligase domain-containing protein [Spirosoma lacussanchae]
MSKSIHFISIGGSAMHNLALALHQQGYIVTGSDDEIYEPSRSRLQQQGLLPATIGWFPEKIHAELEAVIVGMHARKDNPELVRAQELGLPIFSYPEYIYQQSKQKQRVVIAGSHGKTTITSIVMHVLKYHNRQFDYLVGAQLNGFETMAKLSADAPLIVIEGDEYASSPVDSQPKFLHYHPHIALISGIAWDHVNLYPTWELYVDQFEMLAEAMPKGGILIFDESDDMLDVIGQKERADVNEIPYQAHPHTIVDGATFLITRQSKQIPVQIFGEHNMRNLSGALTVLDQIGITDDQFYEAISSFKGAAHRLEKVAQNGTRIVFRDFAHSPSKVEATTEAVKQQFPSKRLLAAFELHTYSSLNKTFLSQYKGSLDSADTAVVYFDVNTFAIKQLSPISPDDVKIAFERPDLTVLTDPADLEAYLSSQRDKADAFLFMSSGTFGGVNLETLSDQLI